MAETSSSPPSQTPNPPAPPRDFLLHLEAYLARRDGVDKLLKIARYAARLALSTAPLPASASSRLKSFDSSVGLSRKAFRLGKFVQDLNALRSAAGTSSGGAELLLAVVSYGGEGTYYFIEQFVWLAKAGLLPAHALPRLQRLSAWAELVGYVGSVALKVREVNKIASLIDAKAAACCDAGGEVRRLREKLLLKRLSMVQDVADAVMALGDVTDDKGWLGSPALMASAGLLSATISTHKNWNAC